MPRYKVLKWTAVGSDGIRKKRGETVELSEDDARFYGDRLTRVGKQSTDMTAVEAAQYIRDNPNDEAFLAEDETRKTVKDAWHE